MKDKDNVKAEEIRFGAISVISRSEYIRCPERHEYELKSRLRLTMADRLIKERIEKKITDERVEFRCDLYIATPEKFWQLVNLEAERIANRYGQTIQKSIC